MRIDMTFISLFGIAVIFTSLSYVIGIYIIEKKMKLAGSFLIGIIVVTLGYFANYIHLPFWLVIGLPIPFGIILLWYIVGRKIKITIMSYIATWIVYLAFHIMLSIIFHYDFLIPAWHLHP